MPQIVSVFEFASVNSRVSMPRQFRWPELSHNICLAREVVGRRPSKPLEWEEVAAIPSRTFSTSTKPVKLKGRGCRERLERLVEKFRTEESQSLKR